MYLKLLNSTNSTTSKLIIMKKILSLIGMVVTMFTTAFSQTVPVGMKYQAVARTTAGEIIANSPITLRIELKGAPLHGAKSYYTEDHALTTNKLGLFDLVVGMGKNSTGNFNNVPWSSEDIWMAVSLKDKSNGFTAVTESRLLAVPYAFYAVTASKLTNNNNIGGGPVSSANAPGVPANVWSLQGNYNSNPLYDKLGTTDYADLVMITNNIERLRITAAGNIEIKRSLKIGANLTVDSSVFLNRISGSTINYGPFTVDRLSPTLLSGILTVDGATDLNNSLNVDGPTDLNSRLFVNNASPTKLTGTLQVDGTTDLNAALSVNNMSPTTLTGTLRVDKDALFKQKILLDNASLQSTSTTTGALVVNGGFGLGGNLNVGGASKFGGPVAFAAAVTISDSTQSTSKFTGALKVTGGVGIGKRLNVGEGVLFESTLGVAGITSVTNATQSTATNNGALVVAGGAGIAQNVNVGGTLTTAGVATINNTLNVNGGGSYVANFVNSSNTNGISIQVAAPTPSNDNNYVTFRNSIGNSVGRIQGENISDLQNSEDYKVNKASLDLAVTLSTISVVTGGIAVISAGVDLVGAASSSTGCAGLGVCVTAPVPSLIVAAGVNLAAAVADEVSIAIGLSEATAQRNRFVTNSITSLGVTYQSGSADYAEWLPKMNSTEKFRPGQIVGMKNGHISLDVKDADKLFVISTKPIVLGNMPEEGKEAAYEKVAFMGQVPVHILGKVNAGDYILPSGNNDGFGKALAPASMKAADYQNIVGMAWSSSTNSSYNLINTAIGLNAGDISKVVASQNIEINELKKQINDTKSILAKLVPGFKEAAGITSNAVVATPAAIVSTNKTAPTHPEFFIPNEQSITYFDITDAQIETMLSLAKKMHDEQGVKSNTDIFWNKMTTDADYKAKVTAQMKATISKSLHYHQDINKGK